MFPLVFLKKVQHGTPISPDHVTCGLTNSYPISKPGSVIGHRFVVSVQSESSSLLFQKLVQSEYPSSSASNYFFAFFALFVVWVFLVPFLLRGVGFPIHPFLRGLLEFYRIQLHHLIPNSILHIAGFIALCEMYLGCEAHFGLWRKYFCIVPCSLDEAI